MKETAFNLVDEPWIRVMTPDCGVSEVSLLDALVNAHTYKSLAGEMEAQNVAVLRLLIAVAHTVFTRVNLNGEQDPVEDEKAAMDRWAALMRSGKLPPDPIRDYLQTWHERFWLFHPERPFYQVPSAKNGTEYTAAKLNGAVSESGNNARLFSSVAGVEKLSMSFSESVRWLLFINGFDDCAAKPKGKDLPSIKVAWLGQLGLVTVAGDSLFESILLNMTMLIDGEEIWQKDDQPIWELGEVREKERETISMPQDFAGLLTLQSRRLLLIREEDRVTGYHVLGGEAFDETSDKSEPMTLWKKGEINKKLIFKPCQHDRARQIWRDFGAFVKVGENERRPGVVAWCSLLQNKRIVPRHRYITFRICSTRYKPPLLSCITDSFSDVLSFHVNLLTDAGKVWIRQIEEQLNKIEEAAMQVGNLEVNLGKALGLYNNDSQKTKEAMKKARETAKERFYIEIDQPFREWLLGLDPNQDSDEKINLIREWQSKAWRIAMHVGQQLFDEKGDLAFVGRTIEDKKKKEKRHYSSPEAYRWFTYHLGNIYPIAKEGEEQHG